MISNDDEDHEFFTTPTGSKLSSLFNSEQLGSGNESFTYTAPKEPKKIQKGATSSSNAAGSTSSIMFASAVQTYKFLEGKACSQGKLGLAIIGTHATSDYKLLLYINKQQQVTNAKITREFSLTVQPNNYMAFYDDGRQSWSVLFESTDQLTQFLKQALLAKTLHAVGSGTFNAVILQDLATGDGASLEKGSSVEIVHTGWLLQDYNYGQIFSSNTPEQPLRFKLGSGKLIKSWEDALIGMKKNGRRLIAVPSSLAYGTEGKGSSIPPNAALIIDFSVLRVKVQKEKGSPDSSVRSSPVSVPIVSNDSIMDDRPVQTSADKAKLMSRIAKMGQPMLPLAGAVPARIDSEEESLGSVDNAHSPLPTPKKPEIPAKPVHHFQPISTFSFTPDGGHMMSVGSVISHPQPVIYQPTSVPSHVQMYSHSPMAAGLGSQVSSQVALYQPPAYPTQPFLQNAMPNALPYQQTQLPQFQQTQLPQFQQTQLPQFQPQTQPFPASTSANTGQSASVDSLNNFMLSEVRQQSVEVRLTLDRLNEKIDRVNEKLHTIQQPSNALSLPGSSMTMESGMLLYSIQKIVQENDQLKKELLEKSTKIENQNLKIAELIQANQKVMEQSNSWLEQRNDNYKSSAVQIQSHVLSLEQEKLQLTTELSTVTAQLSTIHVEMANSKKREQELRQQLDTLLVQADEWKNEISKLRLVHSDDETQLQQTSTQLKEEKQARRQLDSQLNAVQEELTELRIARDNLEKAALEKKRKLEEERRQWNDENEQMKQRYENDIAQLKEKLRLQRTSTDSATVEKMQSMEVEITREWKEKCERLQAAAHEKLLREQQEWESERQSFENRINEYEKKIISLKQQLSEADAQILAARDDAENNSLFRTKFESLRNQAVLMRDKYEKNLAELESSYEKTQSELRESELLTESLKREVESSRQHNSSLQEKVDTLMNERVSITEKFKNLLVEKEQERNIKTNDDISTEIKRIMNSVYQSVSKKFDRQKKYNGTKIQEHMLNIIKKTTLKTLGQFVDDESSEEEDSSEEIVVKNNSSLESEKSNHQLVHEQSMLKQYPASGEEYNSSNDDNEDSVDNENYASRNNHSSVATCNEISDVAVNNQMEDSVEQDVSVSLHREANDNLSERGTGTREKHDDSVNAENIKTVPEIELASDNKVVVEDSSDIISNTYNQKNDTTCSSIEITEETNGFVLDENDILESQVLEKHDKLIEESNANLKNEASQQEHVDVLSEMKQHISSGDDDLFTANDTSVKQASMTEEHLNKTNPINEDLCSEENTALATALNSQLNTVDSIKSMTDNSIEKQVSSDDEDLFSAESTSVKQASMMEKQLNWTNPINKDLHNEENTALATALSRQQNTVDSIKSVADNSIDYSNIDSVQTGSEDAIFSSSEALNKTTAELNPTNDSSSPDNTSAVAAPDNGTVLQQSTDDSTDILETGPVNKPSLPPQASDASIIKPPMGPLFDIDDDDSDMIAMFVPSATTTKTPQAPSATASSIINNAKNNSSGSSTRPKPPSLFPDDDDDDDHLDWLN